MPTPDCSTRADVRDLYQSLVEGRKAYGLCPGLTNPASVRYGRLNSAEIGPYSTWQADLNAKLMIVGKDFAPVGVFEELGGRPGSRVQTNLRLRRHLQRIGFEIGTPANRAPGSRREETGGPCPGYALGLDNLHRSDP